MTYFANTTNVKQKFEDNSSKEKKELAMRNLKGVLSDRNLSSDEIRDERLERLFKNQSV